MLDLAQVTFFSAAEIEALLRVRDAVMATAGHLILRNPSPIVLTVLAGARVTHGFQIHTSRQGDTRLLFSRPVPAPARRGPKPRRGHGAATGRLPSSATLPDRYGRPGPTRSGH